MNKLFYIPIQSKIYLQYSGIGSIYTGELE